MLDSIFLKVLDMTKIACIVILVVLAARMLLKRAPKWISYALWAVVLFRLLCPVSIEASVSILPTVTPAEETYALADESISVFGAGVAAYRAVGDALNGGLGVQYIQTTQPSADGGKVYVTTDWWDVWILFGQYVWLAGILVMLAYSVLSYLKIRKKLQVVVPLRDNIFLADDIQSPFVVGFPRPKIYLPCTLEEREQDYIILHEQYHIKRWDHVIKALAFLALTVHWFNPLVWLAFILASKDMEMSCDEAVVKKMGEGIRADYSASLLTLATGRRIISGTPLAFGEGNTKERIRNLANWKKPALWLVTVSVIVCIVLTGCLMTDPKEKSVLQTTGTAKYYLTIGEEGVTSIEVSAPGRSGGCQNADGTPFKKGDRVWVEMLDGYTDLKGVSITALDEEGAVVFGVSIADNPETDPVTEVFPGEWQLVREGTESAVVADRAKPTEPAATGEYLPGKRSEQEAADQAGDAFELAVTAAIIQHNQYGLFEGRWSTASFIAMHEEAYAIGKDGGFKGVDTVTVYGLAMFQTFTNSSEQAFYSVRGSHLPVRMTFEVEGDDYVLTEYWTPRDGSYYEPDVRNCFPDEIEEEAMNTVKYVDRQMQECYEQAIRAGNIDTAPLIEELFARMQSKPSIFSNPGAYIKANPDQWRHLYYFGRYTLEYCFNQFLTGGQTDLKGHLMALICEDIAAGWGEGETVQWGTIRTMTGQDWFDEYLEYAKELGAQRTAEDLAWTHPASLLLLQMTE